MEKKDINSYFEFDRQELFRILLDLLGVFRGLCEKYHLAFYAQGGTMLGAVRHHGFIPWDDDIDLAMLREDFDKLLDIIRTEELPEPYRFLTPLTDNQYHKGLIRLCNTSTTAISVNNAAHDYNHGIFIDIFPIDSIPDGKISLLAYKLSVRYHAAIITANTRYYMGKNGLTGLRPIVKAFYYTVCPLFYLHLVNREKLVRSFNRAASKYKGKNKKRVCLSTFMIVPRYINQMADYHVEVLEMPFEDTTIPVPESYDRILRIHFGDNYMTPIHESTMHGNTLFATDIPYKQFIETYRDELIALELEYRKSEKA